MGQSGEKWDLDQVSATGAEWTASDGEAGDAQLLGRKVTEMFLGTYLHALDAKGRVAIPARYRDVLSQEKEPGLILTIHSGDAGQCVVVYPRAPFFRLAEKLVTDGPMDPRLERYARAILPTATEVAPDRQGRVLLPATLRDLVGIQREVVWVGMFNRMEIWDRDRWDASHKADLSEVGSLNKLYVELLGKGRE